MNLLLILFIFTLFKPIYPCGQKYIQHKLTVIQYPIQSSRLLANDPPHPLQIYGQFPTSTSANIDIGILRTIFGVASKYFSNVIKVTSLASSTRYPINAGPCGITVPSTYTDSGFDQTYIDMVIFIVIENKKQQSYVAAAAPCLKIRRPIYGFVIFNAAYVTTSMTKPAAFHQNIYVTMHQMTHILGFNDQFYSMFYTSPTSNNYLPLSSVVQNIGKRQMIITPTVMTYVQTYFNCFDGTTGGLLQNQGGSGSAGSHWQRKVYLNQMMTASQWSSGLRITQLTLSLLKDTNFYQSVDLSFGQIPFWGSGKGCSFAQGLSSNPPQFCSNSANNLCDFYGQYIGYCSSSDPFSDSSTYTLAYANSICTFPQYQINSGTPNQKNKFNVFSSSSHCFNSPVLSSAQCYQAICYDNYITVKINGISGNCTTQNQVITLSDITINCPANITVFCASKVCPNWCNNRGLCIKGSCICLPPWSGSACQNGCNTLYYDTYSNSCVQKCLSTQFIYNKSMCMSQCPSGYIIQGKECVVCDILCKLSNLWQSRINIVLMTIIIILLND